MLEGFNGLTKVENGLALVPIDSLLESELERRLYRRLLRFNDEDLDFVVTARESARLELTVADRKWQVTPQRHVDELQTAAPCRADFLIEPLGFNTSVAGAGHAWGIFGLEARQCCWQWQCKFASV